MTEYADIVLENGTDPELGGWREWLVIETTDGGSVRFRCDYHAPGKEERSTWYDQGASFDAEHLDAVIDALTRIRDETELEPVAPLASEDAARLDPGVRRTVALLRGHGFNTTDSGDGVTKLQAAYCEEPTFNRPTILHEFGILDVPHVVCVTTPERMMGEARRLRALLDAALRDATRASVDATWTAGSDVATLMVSGVGDEDLTMESD